MPLDCANPHARLKGMADCTVLTATLARLSLGRHSRIPIQITISVDVDTKGVSSLGQNVPLTT